MAGHFIGYVEPIKNGRQTLSVVVVKIYSESLKRSKTMNANLAPLSVVKFPGNLFIHLQFLVVWDAMMMFVCFSITRTYCKAKQYRYFS